MDSFNCILCGGSEWVNVDQFRIKPQGMIMCNSCAFITYDKCSDVKKVNQSYEHEYRNAPTVNNIFTSERKLHYHVHFLEEILLGWKEKEFKVLEIGAALGLFLNWCKSQFPKCSVYGTELTESFVRVASYLYKLDLKSDFDDSIKYDLISSYKVAEHMPDIDKQLARYKKSLNEGGYLYISVPTWFGRLNNFGATGFALEDYYDPHHVNVWSVKQFEYLLKRSGFSIVKENHTWYDDTYLCKVDNALEVPAYKEDPKERLVQLKKIYDASLAYDQSKFGEAIGHWPNFPAAQVSHYEMNRSRAHQEGFDAIWGTFLKPALDACGNSHFILCHIVDILMRYEKYPQAIEYCKVWLDNHPMDTQALMNMAHILRVQALGLTNQKEKIHNLVQANGLLAMIEKHSLERRYEAMTWIMQNAALMPTKFEGTLH